MAVAALVLGIFSIILSFFSFIGWLGIILGILSVVLGAIARKNGQGSLATAGLVVGIIGLSMSTIFYLACVACVSGAESAINDAINDAFNSLNY